MAIVGVRHGLTARGGFNVDIKLDGDWFKLNMLLNSFGPEIMIIARASQRKFAEKYRDRVKTNMRTGGRRFGYKPVSSRYSSYKQKKGGGSTTFIWSKTLHDSVSVLDSSGNRVSVGIPKGIRRPFYPGESKRSNQLTVSEYANILEHGAYSRGVPARPIFSDTFREDMKGKAGLRRSIQRNIIIGMRARGIRINQI